MPYVVAACYINLEEHADRRAHMEEFVKAFDFPVQRFVASSPSSLRHLTLDGVPAVRQRQVACFDSHLSVMKRFLSNPQGPPFLLILEDDIDWNEGIGPARVNEAVRAFTAYADQEPLKYGLWLGTYVRPHKRWTCVNPVRGILPMPDKEQFSRDYYACMHAYIMHRQAIAAFVAHCQQHPDITTTQPVDLAMADFLAAGCWPILSIVAPVSPDGRFRGLLRQRRDVFASAIPTSR